MASTLLERARQAAAEYEKLNLTRNSVFWAEKAVCLSNGAFEDVHSLANSLYRDGQYRRAVHVLERDNLLEVHLSCRYLGALCDVAQKDFESAIEKLELGPNTTSAGLNVAGPSLHCNLVLSPEDEKLFAGRQSQARAALCCLRGVAYQELLNMPVAHHCYIEALRLDPLCYEAWDRLTANSVMDESAEREVFKMVTGLLHGNFSEEDCSTINFLYNMRLQCKCQHSEPLVPPRGLEDSSDVISCQALQSYTKYDVHAALDSSNRVLDRDPLHPFCLLVHLGCLVALAKKNELFVLAHEAVQDFPEQASSWYAIGCYYLTVNEYEKARLHFSKATSLDPNFGLAWTAFGHAFGADGIHDQANTCYFSAMKVMPGSHYPLINVALYHSMNHDPALATKYLKQAEALVPLDGMVCHERATLAYQQRNYNVALQYYLRALDVCNNSAKDKVSSSSWEPLLNNVAHCYRRMKDYDSALQFHHRALALDCTKSSTHTSIGFIHSLCGAFDKAIEHFHKALRLNRQDIIAIDMLEKTADCLVVDQDFVEKILGMDMNTTSCGGDGDGDDDSMDCRTASLDLCAIKRDCSVLGDMQLSAAAASSHASDGDLSYLPDATSRRMRAFATPNFRGSGAGGVGMFAGGPVIMARLSGGGGASSNSAVGATPAHAAAASAYGNRRSTPTGAVGGGAAGAGGEGHPQSRTGQPLDFTMREELDSNMDLD